MDRTTEVVSISKEQPVKVVTPTRILKRRYRLAVTNNTKIDKKSLRQPGF